LAYSGTDHRPVVLIVEDEFLIRMDAIDMIRSGGFEVVEANDADEAIEILERRPDITVVFTDVHMPGSMDGLKLAAAVRGRWPPIKIVATSGRANPERRRSALWQPLPDKAVQRARNREYVARGDRQLFLEVAGPELTASEPIALAGGHIPCLMSRSNPKEAASSSRCQIDPPRPLER
jgi:two-component system, response regulator PdtaR